MTTAEVTAHLKTKTRSRARWIFALLIIVMGLWFFGWAGTLFLSSTRVIFAAAFDRVLPAWAANISAKRRVPYGSLVLMIVPSLVISAIYSYKPSFTSVFLDAIAYDCLLHRLPPSVRGAGRIVADGASRRLVRPRAGA